MKRIALLLVIFHAIILVFWIANSSLLFSLWGIGSMAWLNDCWICLVKSNKRGKHHEKATSSV